MKELQDGEMYMDKAGFAPCLARRGLLPVWLEHKGVLVSVGIDIASVVSGCSPGLTPVWLEQRYRDFVANLALNFDMSDDALRLAISHQVDLITSHDRDRIARIYDRNDRSTNLLSHEFDRLSAAKHYNLMRQGQQASRKYTSTMSDDRLRQDGALT